MPPTPLDGKPLALDSPADRRAYFADWLTAPDNPYFARALVNRVWRNFLGRGLVEAEDDLRQTNPPTNADLFDALAKDFVEHKLRRQASDPHDHELGGLSAFVEAAAGQRRRRSLLFALPGSPAAGRGDPRRLLAGDRRADAVHEIYTGVERGVDGYDGYPLGTRALQLPDSRWRRASSTPSAGRTGRKPAPANASRMPASARRCTSTMAQTLNDKLRAKKLAVSISGRMTKSPTTRRCAVSISWPLAASRRRPSEEVHRPDGRGRREPVPAPRSRWKTCSGPC